MGGWVGGWRTAIPNATLLLSLAGAATSIIFVATNKCFVTKNTPLLSRQKYACRHRRFFAKTLCLSRQNIFVATKLLLRQILVCRDKHTFVATKDVFCCDKHVFVARKISLSRPNFCGGVENRSTLTLHHQNDSCIKERGEITIPNATLSPLE